MAGYVLSNILPSRSCNSWEPVYFRHQIALSYNTCPSANDDVSQQYLTFNTSTIHLRLEQ